MQHADDVVVALLRAQLSVLGRMAFDSSALDEVICKGRDPDKQRKAYNLCDGSRTQSEVAKAAKLDAGNFSRTVNRWIESGVMFKIPDGNDAKLQHLFPLGAPPNKADKKTRKPN